MTVFGGEACTGVAEFRIRWILKRQRSATDNFWATAFVARNHLSHSYASSAFDWSRLQKF